MIASVVLRGYGNGTVAGTIALVSTEGYAIGAASAGTDPAAWIEQRRRKAS